MGDEHIIRGGGASDESRDTRPANRGWDEPIAVFRDVGIRPVLKKKRNEKNQGSNKGRSLV